MPEQLPNQANTAGSYATTPQNPLEVTREDIDMAGFQDVPVAIDNYINNVHGRMDTATSPAVQKGLEKELERGELANDWSIKWFENNRKRTEAYQGHETFKQFLDRTQAEETHPVLLEQVEKVSTFVYSGAYDKFMSDAIRTRREQEAVESENRVSRAERPSAPSVEEIQAQQRADQQRKATDEAKAREAVEQARGVEIFDDIVRFAKDKTYLYTDIKGYTPLGDARVKDSSRTQIPQSILQEARKNPDYRQHLNEAVMFSGLTESDKRTVTKERQVKGRFGRSTTETYTDTEAVPNSKHPVMIHNEQTGQDEPSIRFRYNFKYSDYMSVDDSRALPPYQEFQGGRSGQTIQASVDLPESIANKLKVQIEEDPSSVRELVEKLFLNNHDGRMTEEYWRKGGSVGHPVRPPYEKLPEDWTIALIDHTSKDSSQGYQIKRLAASH